MRWIAALAICLLAANARAQDWGVRRDPFDAGVVRRYKAILARDPHDAGALRALVSMYKRHRTLAKLESEYRAALEASESWPTLVVLARLPRDSRSDTIALWKRALELNEHDARGWLAFGELAPDAATALDAYQRAAKYAASPRDKQLALRKVIGAATSAGDANAVDAAYAELIALAPKAGALWHERGDAQLTAGRLAEASESFAAAESLLATDPERRLTVMMNRGLVLERQQRVDDAIEHYARTLDKVPRGHHLGRELVARIIEAERKRGRLAAAIARFEQRWPERSRHYFEWATLGDLYKRVGDDERAIAAYRQAVRKAPTEIGTQRKLIALLDRVRPDEALAQHEIAARVAPGDADLQIELAKRYFATHPAKAFATLDRLARRMARNVNVRRTLAELYTQWEQATRAIREYEAIAELEPHDPDHAIVLGEAYWRTGDQDKARAAWQRLARIGTASALYRQGAILALHDLWDDAVAAYTQSLALDATMPETWQGRARAYIELSRLPEAVADAKRAVALIGHATHGDGGRARQLLVRALGLAHADAAGSQLPATLARWRFAFEHGDVAAGYLLVAHHTRIGSYQLHDVLVELYRRVPNDDSLGIALARSFARRKDFTRARQELERIARRTPARAEEIGRMLAYLEGERARAEQEARWDEEGLSPRERSQRRATGRPPDLVGARRKFGVRLGLGADVRHASSAQLELGLYRTHRIADGTAIAARLDWLQRDDAMEEVNAFATSIGVARRVVDARRFELAVGVAPRFELRYGSDAAQSAWGRAALAGDVTVELVPRALPAVLGLRFHQSLTDDGHPSALVLELGFEVR